MKYTCNFRKQQAMYTVDLRYCTLAIFMSFHVGSIVDPNFSVFECVKCKILPTLIANTRKPFDHVLPRPFPIHISPASGDSGPLWLTPNRSDLGHFNLYFAYLSIHVQYTFFTCKYTYNIRIYIYIYIYINMYIYIYTHI